MGNFVTHAVRTALQAAWVTSYPSYGMQLVVDSGWYKMGDDVCSVAKYLEVVSAGRDEYERLSRFHYRDCSLGPYAAVYALKDLHVGRSRFGDLAGVIVYSMPAGSVAVRNVATGGEFSGFGDRRMQMQMVNRHIRCISRVIIDPRYRGLGLASRLVRETMPLLGVAIVEAMAVMGRVNPFFERAGMRAYDVAVSVKCVRLIEAFGMVGIGERDLIDARAVHGEIERLEDGQGEFIEGQMLGFLESYGRRKYMEPGVERTRYVLSKLIGSWVYYVWFNPEVKVGA